MIQSHKSVLLDEALEGLNVKKGETYVDCTLGGGGHTKKILELGGMVFGLDMDPEVIRSLAKEMSLDLREGDALVAKGEKITIAQGNFKNLAEYARDFGVWETSGVLFDLGWSSLQIETKGFSFMVDSPLDMRLSPDLGVSAADLINGLSTGELNELFSFYGEESNSRRIARAIDQARVKEKIKTTGELAKIVERVVPRRGRTHPATKVFQALRIVVNGELENLEEGLKQAESLLKKEGRLVVISFHSLEDRIVKRFLKENASFRSLTEKPIVPQETEVEANSRARSAKMRIAEKV